MTKTVAITGASGFLGSALVRHFSSQGWQVIAMMRSPEKYPLQASVTCRKYDLTTQINSKDLADVDYVIHAAYAKQSARLDAYKINFEAARHLLGASRAAKVKKRLFISSMSSHAGAVSVYGRQKFAIEKLFKGPDDISLRPGLIVGNGGIVKDMANFMTTKHFVPLIGGGHQPIQIVDIDELCLAIEHALISDLSGVMTVATPQVYSYKQFYKAIASHLKIKVFFVPAPFFIIRIALKLAGLLRLTLPVSEDNLLGLKKLASFDTTDDLAKLDVSLSDLDSSIAKSTLVSSS